MKRLEIPKGTRFGRLKVLKEVEGSRRTFRLICDCGNKKDINLSNLKMGRTLSCGCLNRELLDKTAKARSDASGKNHPLYAPHKNRINRCSDNPNISDYKNYGGRGIRVVKEWLGDKGFWTFVKWAEANGWSEGCGLTLERKDNDGPYSPSNCKWIPKADQVRNTRLSWYVTYKGERILAIEAMEKYGVEGLTYFTLRARIKRQKWSVNKSLKTPIKGK